MKHQVPGIVSSIAGAHCPKGQYTDATAGRCLPIVRFAFHRGRSVTMLNRNGGPDTIVLVHGLWMTPRSWENWVAHFENKGYRVLAPPYPGFDIEVEALRANPSVIADLTVPETVAYLETVIRGLDRPPIIMGHSF